MTESRPPRTVHDWNDQVVRIYIDDLGYFQGIVIEVTSSTVCVDFPVTFAPGLRINQRVNLAFTAARLGSSLKVPSQVVYLGEDEHRCRIRFEIGDESRIALSTLIESRSEFRVSPDAGAPVAVASDPFELEVDGILDDYSSAGLSVFVRAVDLERMAQACRMRFRLFLPETRTEVALFGHVRAREVLDDHVRLGVELETSGSVEIMRDHERFERHVRYLQAQVLARLSAARRSAG